MPDAGRPDASAPDAGAPDAGRPDAGGADAGRTLWLHHPSEPKHELSGGVAVSEAGAVFTAATHGAEAPYSIAGAAELRLVVTRLGPDGAVAWARPYAVTRPPPQGDIQDSGAIRARIAASASGDVSLAGEVRGSVSFGGGVLQTGAFLAKLSPAGEHRWSQALPAGYEVTALAADAAGNTYVGVLAQGTPLPDSGCVPMDGRVLKYGPQGTRVWEASIGEPQCDGNRAEVRALAVDGAGRVALGGAFSGELRFGAQRFQTSRFSPYFAVLAADGRLAWLQPFASTWGGVSGIGVSARGTVVATGVQYSTGHIDWAGVRLEKTGATDQGFLLAAEADGKARWAKDLGPTERPVLAVEPAGSAVVAGLTRSYVDPQRPGVDPSTNPQLFASRYTLDGTRLWTRIFQRSEGRADLFAEEVVGAAIIPGAGGASALAGQFSTPTDFGTGRREPANTDVFVLRLAP